MIIDKQATTTEGLRRRFSPYPNARSAFLAFLRAARVSGEECVLLPAYVGWSAREGSGVFDPVREAGCAFAFYRVDRRLRIDLQHMREVLRSRRVKVVVLIHYFGYVDPSHAKAVELAREAGAVVMEDEAHAMLTDLIGGASGRDGDACIFSLHKMLPVPSGGVLVTNSGGRVDVPSEGQGAGGVASPWDYDLAEMARRRRENALRLHELLPQAGDRVEPLWPPPGEAQVPQTLPVLVHRVSRDKLYFAMNEAGFGVVSLYHTMIGEISAEQFPDSHFLARQVMNLPVHPDARPAQLEQMVTCLGRLLRELA